MKALAPFLSMWLLISFVPRLSLGEEPQADSSGLALKLGLSISTTELLGLDDLNEPGGENELWLGLGAGFEWSAEDSVFIGLDLTVWDHFSGSQLPSQLVATTKAGWRFLPEQSVRPTLALTFSCNLGAPFWADDPGFSGQGCGFGAGLGFEVSVPGRLTIRYEARAREYEGPTEVPWDPAPPPPPSSGGFLDLFADEVFHQIDLLIDPESAEDPDKPPFPGL